MINSITQIIKTPLNMALLQELYEIRLNDAYISAACELRYARILVDTLKVTKSNRPVDENTIHIIQEHYIPLLRRIEAFNSAWGFFVFMIVKKEFYIKKKKIISDVIELPNIGTFIVYIENNNKLTASTVDKTELFVMKSGLHGELMTTAIHSEINLIYKMYHRFHTVQQQAYAAFAKSCNPLFVLEHVITREIIETGIHALSIQDQSDPSFVNAALENLMHNTGDEIQFKTSNDPDAASYLKIPKFYKIVNNHSIPDINNEFIGAVRRDYENCIAHVLKIPLSCVSSIDKHFSQNSADSLVRHEAKQLNYITDVLRKDLIRVMKHIWLVVHGDDQVEFSMDNYVDVEMEDVMRADQLNLIDPTELQHIVKENLGILQDEDGKQDKASKEMINIKKKITNQLANPPKPPAAKRVKPSQPNSSKKKEG
jgi:hypothetical protein